MVHKSARQREDAGMAPRFSWRRKIARPDITDEMPHQLPDEGVVDGVHLDDDEHAWWAQRDLADVWSPRQPSPVEEATTDVLAAEFGPDWRTSFDFERDVEDHAINSSPEPEADPDPSEESSEPSAPPGPSDPYAVLELDPSSSWEQIVDAHRGMARRHHPDRLFGQSRAEVAAAEDRIRAINVAYQELRVRRGK